MWRRFNFWERHAQEAPRELLKQSWQCAVAGTAGPGGAGVVFFGGEEGTLAVVDTPRLRPVAGWKAHDVRVTYVVHCNTVCAPGARPACLLAWT